MNSKHKGNRWERELSEILTEFYGKPFRRVPNSGAYFGKSNYVRSEGMDESVKQCLSGDLICPEDFEYSIEAKSYKDFEFWNILNENCAKLDDWIEQAESDSKFSKRKMFLAIKIDRKVKMVCFKKSENILLEFDNYYRYKKDYILVELYSFLDKIKPSVVKDINTIEIKEEQKNV